MKTSKVPMRTCIVCRVSKPKQELIRIVKTPEGIITVDISGKKNGRGVYICKCEKCALELNKTKRLNRSFEVDVTAEAYSKISEDIQQLLRGNGGGDFADK